MPLQASVGVRLCTQPSCFNSGTSTLLAKGEPAGADISGRGPAVRLFRDASIKRKLTVMIMVTSCVVLLLTSVAFIGTELVAYRRGMVDKATSLAEIIGANSRVALIFKDAAAASETLSSLAKVQSIEVAYIFAKNNKPFAQFVNPDYAQPHNHSNEFDTLCDKLPETLKSGAAGYCLTASHLAVFRPIILDGEVIGSVFLQSDMSELQNQLLWFAFGAFGVLGFSVLLAYLLASGQRAERLFHPQPKRERR